MSTEVAKNMDVNIDGIKLPGLLFLPNGATRLVVFAHGSGSSRLSPRNQFIAEFMYDRGIASFLFDLLTLDEDLIQEKRFDISLITDRLVKVTEWLTSQDNIHGLHMGYFGASTGAAAALSAAVSLPQQIKAVVSRGGRPDLALPPLEKIKTPTLMIVGELDELVIEINQQAAGKLGGEYKLEIVPGASHLFEENGTLEKVAELSVEWFDKYLI